MEALLKKKLLRLILLLNTPKEEVLEILPFVIGKAVLLAFADKFTESLASLTLDPDALKQANPETKVYQLVFNLLNGGT
jgi:hypothetical protein